MIHKIVPTLHKHLFLRAGLKLNQDRNNDRLPYMFNKLKQFKDLRNQAKEMQNTLAKETVYADSAGGKIQIVMDGNQHVNGVSIDPEFLNPNKKMELERSMRDAINDAVKKAQTAMAKKAREMGHLNLPGLQ